MFKEKEQLDAIVPGCLLKALEKGPTLGAMVTTTPWRERVTKTSSPDRAEFHLRFFCVHRLSRTLPISSCVQICKCINVSMYKCTTVQINVSMYKCITAHTHIHLGATWQFCQHEKMQVGIPNLRNERENVTTTTLQSKAQCSRTHRMIGVP